MIKKKNLSEKNRKAWEDFIKNPSDVYDKEKTFKDKINKARYKFDLHGFALDDANKKVKELIFFGVENEYDEILLLPKEFTPKMKMMYMFQKILLS